MGGLSGVPPYKSPWPTYPNAAMSWDEVCLAIQLMHDLSSGWYVPTVEEFTKDWGKPRKNP